MPEESLSIEPPKLNLIPVRWGAMSDEEMMARWPITPWPAERVDGSNIKLVYESFESLILDKPFEIPPGFSFRAKEGHFFRFVAGKPDGHRKGMIQEASSSLDAIAGIKDGRFGPDKIAGYEHGRGGNIMVIPHILENPDCVLYEAPRRIGTKPSLLLLKRYGNETRNLLINVVFRLDDGESLALLSHHSANKTRPGWWKNKSVYWSSEQMRSLVEEYS